MNAAYWFNVDTLKTYIKENSQPGFSFSSDELRYGIVMFNKYFCVFVNSETNEYDVTVDAWDINDASFSNCLDWESYQSPEEALKALREKVSEYQYKALNMVPNH